MAYHVENYKYIYELPYIQRTEICEILNQNNSWEELAVRWMGFDIREVQSLRLKSNPADELLNKWGQRNHKIYELFVLLSKMGHFKAMLPLKNYVGSKLHILLYHTEKSLQNSGKNKEEEKNSIIVPDSMLGNFAHNFNPFVTPMTDILTTLPSVSYYELARATNNWTKENLIGEGGFGKVFKGNWKNTDVAIKKIEPKDFEFNESYAIQLEQSFKEITILNSLPHENILQIFAYSINGEVPCLVYKRMINGSLEDRLRMKHGTAPLNWVQRQDIAKGVARGLQYLHTIYKNPLIHGDIKSANILLDKNFEPKIGDFGLARAGSSDDSIVVSKVLGTRFYLPDDYLVERNLSTKVDTYSYGIVLFELATGLPAYVREVHQSLKEFIDSFCDEEIHKLIDLRAGEKYNDVYAYLICLGKWCSNRKAKNRPEMSTVYEKFH